MLNQIILFPDFGPFGEWTDPKKLQIGGLYRALKSPNWVVGFLEPKILQYGSRGKGPLNYPTWRILGPQNPSFWRWELYELRS